MEPSTQAVPGYFVWEAPGKPVVVHLHLDAVDRMAAEVMRGFGAVPKRGAEVGGVLLGSIEQGDQTIVRVEDFEPVPCEYSRGPSYLFSGQELASFADAVARWGPDPERPAFAVGYFRSHTRDGLALAEEDLELLDRYFPSPAHIALLVKPYATKVSVAGIFFREDGVFPPETALEFPFRRREMSGEDAPPRRPLHERRPRPHDPRGLRSEPGPMAVARSGGLYESGPYDDAAYLDAPYASAEPASSAPASRSHRGARVWIPLSILFLLLGVVLGYQTALTLAPRLQSGAASKLALNLAAAPTGDSLTVRWNRDSAAIDQARNAVLEIEDGGYTKTVNLEVADLRNGTVIYQNSSEAVRFRLVVYLNDRLTLTETLDWRR